MPSSSAESASSAGSASQAGPSSRAVQSRAVTPSWPRARRAVSAVAILVGLTAAAAEPPAVPAPPPPPTDAECRALPGPLLPSTFVPGESLEFELDALNVRAGTLTLRVLPIKDGLMPLQAEARTHPFFGKVRRVRGTGTSFVSPRTLRPRRYVEQSVENEVERAADVTFQPRERRAKLTWRSGQRTGRTELPYGSNDALDVAGALYLLRQLPLAEGQPLCVDVYGVRRMWRVFGKVEKKEHVSLEVGEFEAWHVAATAVRLDSPSQRREVHVWISADARRLPLAALGTIDLGAVRATLTGFSRPGERAVKAAPKGEMKW